MTKDELKVLICSKENNRGRYSKESTFRIHFSVFYNELQTWTFPDNFTFKQKLYHYLNDDTELKLGICPICGNRCKFKNIVIGYRKFCSCSCAQKSEDTKEKYKSTCLKTYGVENPSQSDDIKNKKKKTNIERLGVSCTFQSELVKYKSKQTCLERYGTEYASQSELFRDNVKQTNIKKYGVENPSQREEIKNKYKDFEWVENKLEQTKKSNLEKFGTEWYFQSEECRRVLEEKYKNYEWVNSIKEKRFNTLKKNNTFRTSKIEEQIKQYLDSLGINYIHQYTSDQYPFNCDFYFPDNDLYVEIQGSWTHGPHPFTGTEEDELLLEKWKFKNTKYYQNAIETWTVRDVRKRETAKQNNLNYLEIFSTNLNECIEKIKGAL